jgi:hypothetical protein
MAKPVMTCTYRLHLFPNLLTVAAIIRWIFYCFSTYSSDALNLPCVFTAATRSRRHGRHGSVATTVPFPPAHHFIVCLRWSTGPLNRRVRTTPTALSATANARNPRAPLRTLLRLSPHQESPDHCRGLVRVRHRAATTTLPVDTVRALAVYQNGDTVRTGTTLLDVMRGTSIQPISGLLPIRCTSLMPTFPLPARSPVYILHWLRTSYTSPRVS